MKTTDFIEFENVIYLPRPSSVNAGQSKQLWVQTCLNREPHIAHPDMWEWLLERAKVKTLVENEDSFFIMEN
jgi:hypothetical protein